MINSQQINKLIKCASTIIIVTGLTVQTAGAATKYGIDSAVSIKSQNSVSIKLKNMMGDRWNQEVINDAGYTKNKKDRQGYKLEKSSEGQLYTYNYPVYFD